MRVIIPLKVRSNGIGSKEAHTGKADEVIIPLKVRSNGTSDEDKKKKAKAKLS